MMPEVTRRLVARIAPGKPRTELFLIPDMGGGAWHRLNAQGSGCSPAILNRAPGPELSQGEEFESIFSSTLLPSGGGAKEKDLSLLVMRFTIPWGPLPQTDTLWLV